MEFRLFDHDQILGTRMNESKMDFYGPSVYKSVYIILEKTFVCKSNIGRSRRFLLNFWGLSKFSRVATVFHRGYIDYIVMS